MILLSAALQSLLQLVGVLIIFLFVLVITYFTTKWMGGIQKAQMRAGNLSLLETMRIANNKYIQLVKAGDVYLVIAVGKDEVTKLAELTEEQLPYKQPEQTENKTANFQDILNQFKNNFPKKQD